MESQKRMSDYIYLMHSTISTNFFTRKNDKFHSGMLERYPRTTSGKSQVVWIIYLQHIHNIKFNNSLLE